MKQRLLFPLTLLFCFSLVPLSAQSYDPAWHAFPPDAPAHGLGAAPGSRPPSGPPMRVERDITGDSYLVRILLREDINATAVDIQLRGRQLVIHLSQQDETQTSDNKGYYRYSYSARRGNVARHFSIPRDADISKMARKDEKNMVTLSFPRVVYQY